MFSFVFGLNLNTLTI